MVRFLLCAGIIIIATARSASTRAEPKRYLVTVYACGEPVQRYTVERWERVEGGVYLPTEDITVLGGAMIVQPWRGWARTSTAG